MRFSFASFFYSHGSRSRSSPNEELRFDDQGQIFTAVFPVVSFGFMGLFICLEVINIYGNGFAMLGNLVMYTAYINTFTFDQLKLRLGL